MFLRNEGGSSPTIVSSPSPASGLYIRTRGGDLTKICIPADCLAFQTGEALELVTAGKLQATPHCVRIGGGEDAERISRHARFIALHIYLRLTSLACQRETFALFMQPDIDQSITPSETFGQFSKRIFADHYEDKST
jgi:isopenicillin N synthase-like dioxygenase